MNAYRTTAVLTRKELIQQIVDAIAPDMADSVADYMMGDIEAINKFSKFKDIVDWNNRQIAETWCEYCSEYWMDHNPTVDEVLMDYSSDNKGSAIEKMWVCSKEYEVGKE